MGQVYSDPDWTRLLGPASGRYDVLAQVNGEEIKRESLDEILVRLIAARARRGEPLDPKSMADVRARALDTVINFTIEKQEALKENIPIDEAKIDELYRRSRDAYGSDEEFEKALGEHGETVESFRSICETELRVNELRRRAMLRDIKEPFDK